MAWAIASCNGPSTTSWVRTPIGMRCGTTQVVQPCANERSKRLAPTDGLDIDYVKWLEATVF